MRIRKRHARRAGRLTFWLWNLEYKAAESHRCPTWVWKLVRTLFRRSLPRDLRDRWFWRHYAITDLKTGRRTYCLGGDLFGVIFKEWAE